MKASRSGFYFLVIFSQLFPSIYTKPLLLAFPLHIFLNKISLIHSNLDKSLHGLHFWILYQFRLFNRAFQCSVFLFLRSPALNVSALLMPHLIPRLLLLKSKKDLADIFAEKILNFVPHFSKLSFLLNTNFFFLLLNTLLLCSNSSCSKILYC